jgi:hypothetical protein
MLKIELKSMTAGTNNRTDTDNGRNKCCGEDPSDPFVLGLLDPDTLVRGSVADPDPGFSAFLTSGPGSGIRNRFFPDSGSRIPHPYFFELSDKFLGKKFYNSIIENSPKFFFFKNKIILNFVKFEAAKNVTVQQFFFHSYFLLLFLDPGAKYEAERKIRSAPRETKKWVRCFDCSARKGSATGPISLQSKNFFQAKPSHPNRHRYNSKF